MIFKAHIFLFVFIFHFKVCRIKCDHPVEIFLYASFLRLRLSSMTKSKTCEWAMTFVHISERQAGWKRSFLHSFYSTLVT